MVNHNVIATVIASRVVAEEAAALKNLAQNIDGVFNEIVEYILSISGRVIVTGIGKSGCIAKKLAASLASTGTAAFYLHAAEASHGDLGMITKQDLVIMLSSSGETQELFCIVNYCKKIAVKTVAITMHPSSSIAANSDFLLLLPNTKEASTILAPTTSAVMMLSLGDALAIALQEIRQFTKDDFAILHPGGKIGANLLKVQDLMHSKERLPIVYASTPSVETIIIMTQKGLGCALVIEPDWQLIGIITDGDLRRHLHDLSSRNCASDLMTKNPQHLSESQFATEALAIMRSKSITALPVVKDGILTGLVHIHDLLKVGI